MRESYDAADKYLRAESRGFHRIATPEGKIYNAFVAGWSARDAEVEALESQIAAAQSCLEVYYSADVDILNGRRVMDAEEEKALTLRLLADALSSPAVDAVEGKNRWTER